MPVPRGYVSIDRPAGASSAGFVPISGPDGQPCDCCPEPGSGSGSGSGAGFLPGPIGGECCGYLVQPCGWLFDWPGWSGACHVCARFPAGTYFLEFVSRVEDATTITCTYQYSEPNVYPAGGDPGGGPCFGTVNCPGTLGHGNNCDYAPIATTLPLVISMRCLFNKATNRWTYLLRTNDVGTLTNISVSWTGQQESWNYANGATNVMICSKVVGQSDPDFCCYCDICGNPPDTAGITHVPGPCL